MARLNQTSRTTLLVLFGCALLWAFRHMEHAAGSVLAATTAAAVTSPAAVETGTHWASPSDFPTLGKLGYQFAIVTLGTRREQWRRVFDAAEANNLQLIAGLHPAPYNYTQDGWTITPDGVDFLKYAASRQALVKAIFVYNEPYWVNPFTGSTDACGALSAEQLRGLRTAIRAVWSEAKVFHDIGQPGAWAPGGWYRAQQACLADKYADSTGVADFVGIWSYPFDLAGYHRAASLAVIEREIAFVTTQMGAKPIVDMQAYRCDNCGEATRWPTYDEMKDWNCAVRALGPQAVSWYPWRQQAYDEYLSQHPDMWPATSADNCVAAAVPAARSLPALAPAALLKR
jgi:hypothetical protein